MLSTLFFITAVCIGNVSGFSPAQTRKSVSIQRLPTHHRISQVQRVASSVTTPLYSSPDDKQAEIEALEAKLRELKGESTAEAPQVDESMQSTPADEEEEEPEWEVLKRQSNDSAMLSERWKEADTSSNADGGMLKNLGIALGLVVFLGIFSQIPIGNEDLQRYQDYKGSASRIDLGDLNPDVRVQQ